MSTLWHLHKSEASHSHSVHCCLLVGLKNPPPPPLCFESSLWCLHAFNQLRDLPGVHCGLCLFCGLSSTDTHPFAFSSLGEAKSLGRVQSQRQGPILHSLSRETSEDAFSNQCGCRITDLLSGKKNAHIKFRAEDRVRR